MRNTCSSNAGTDRLSKDYHTARLSAGADINAGFDVAQNSGKPTPSISIETATAFVLTQSFEFNADSGPAGLCVRASIANRREVDALHSPTGADVIGNQYPAEVLMPSTDLIELAGE